VLSKVQYLESLENKNTPVFSPSKQNSSVWTLKLILGPFRKRPLCTTLVVAPKRIVYGGRLRLDGINRTGVSNIVDGDREAKDSTNIASLHWQTVASETWVTSADCVLKERGYRTVGEKRTYTGE
jgi:hypothetical protein